jgi:hypothetical protein
MQLSSDQCLVIVSAKCHGLQYQVRWTGYGPEHNQFIAKRDVAPGLTDEHWARIKKNLI